MSLSFSALPGGRLAGRAFLYQQKAPRCASAACVRGVFSFQRTMRGYFSHRCGDAFSSGGSVVISEVWFVMVRLEFWGGVLQRWRQEMAAGLRPVCASVEKKKAKRRVGLPHLPFFALLMIAGNAGCGASEVCCWPLSIGARALHYSATLRQSINALMYVLIMAGIHKGALKSAAIQFTPLSNNEVSSRGAFFLTVTTGTAS